MVKMKVLKSELSILIVIVLNCVHAEYPFGENTCYVSEKYKDTVWDEILTPVTEISSEWCWSFKSLFKCPKSKTTMRKTHVPRIIEKSRLIRACCTGYKQVKLKYSTFCVPVCTRECVFGECLAPENCTCHPGYRGYLCDKACPSDTGEMDCTRICNCMYDIDCENNNAVCLCKAGYTGLLCEDPCLDGYYGNNCEERCQCNGEPCNHVTGECISMTITTQKVITAEEVTTGEVTTTEERTTTEKITTTTVDTTINTSTTNYVSTINTAPQITTAETPTTTVTNSVTEAPNTRMTNTPEITITKASTDVLTDTEVPTTIQTITENTVFNTVTENNIVIPISENAIVNEDTFTARSDSETISLWVIPEPKTGVSLSTTTEEVVPFEALTTPKNVTKQGFFPTLEEAEGEKVTFRKIQDTESVSVMTTKKHASEVEIKNFDETFTVKSQNTGQLIPATKQQMPSVSVVTTEKVNPAPEVTVTSIDILTEITTKPNYIGQDSLLEKSSFERTTIKHIKDEIGDSDSEEKSAESDYTTKFKSDNEISNVLHNSEEETIMEEELDNILDSIESKVKVNGVDREGVKEFHFYPFIPSLTVFSGVLILIILIAASGFIRNYCKKTRRLQKEKEEMLFNPGGQNKFKRESVFVLTDNPVYLSDIDLNRTTPILQTFKPIDVESGRT